MKDNENPANEQTLADGLWWHLTNEALEVVPACSPIAFAVLACLARHANETTHRCHPSRKTIATTLGVSISTVSRAITALKSIGVIAVTSPPRGAARFNKESNDYQILKYRHQGAPMRPGEVHQGAPMHITSAHQCAGSFFRTRLKEQD